MGQDESARARDGRLELRVSVEMAVAVRGAASDQGASVSAFVRAAIADRLKEVGRT